MCLGAFSFELRDIDTFTLGAIKGAISNEIKSVDCGVQVATEERNTNLKDTISNSPADKKGASVVEQ